MFLFSKLKERLEEGLATWLVKDTKNLHLSSNILWLANCDSLFQQLRQSFGFACAECNKHFNLKPSNTAAFHFWHLTFWNGKWFFKTGSGNGHIKVFEKIPTKNLKKKAWLQLVSSKNIGLNIGAIFQKYRVNIGKMVTTTTTTSLFQIKYSLQRLCRQLAKAIRGVQEKKENCINIYIYIYMLNEQS